MPTDSDSAATRILRLALGTALALWFSQAVGWSMSFIAAVFTLLLLSTPKPAPGLKAGLAIMVLVPLVVYLSLLLLPLLLNFSAAGILLFGLVLFNVFYFTARGGNAVLGTLLTVGLTLIAAVGSVSVDAVLMVAHSVAIAVPVGVMFVWVAHALVPDRAAIAAQPQTAPPPPDPLQARRQAMRSLVIVFPLAVWLLFSADSAGYIGVMIKVTSMTQQVSNSRTREAAASLLLSTVIGGVAALIGWMLLSVWPLLLIYTLFIGLAGLVMGRRIFSGDGMHRDAATWSYAYLTLLIILAPAVTDSLTGSSATIAFGDRLAMFAWATLYGVVAVYVFDAFWPARSKNVIVTESSD